MERKSKGDAFVQPMPKAQFLKLMRDFKAIGGHYLCNAESEEFLISRGAEAMALDGYTILFRRRPTRAAVFEELFHTKQFREGKIKGTPVSRCECEIEAQNYLLANAEQLGLTEREVLQTRKALAFYEREFSKMKGGVS